MNTRACIRSYPPENVLNRRTCGKSGSFPSSCKATSPRALVLIRQPVHFAFNFFYEEDAQLQSFNWSEQGTRKKGDVALNLIHRLSYACCLVKRVDVLLQRRRPLVPSIIGT